MTESELRSFFADYGTSFLETEVQIAAFYGAPCMTARQGIVHLHGTRDHVQAFFAEVLRRYRAQGSTQGDIRSFKSVPLGANSIMTTVTWAYKNAAGQILWEFTFTYNL